MFETMTVVPEVWPVAADETSLWLLSGDDAWRGGSVPADGDVHYEVEMLLWGHGVMLADTAALHSTSWRADGPSVVLTYMAVVSVPGFVKDKWPQALPITPEFAAKVGKPPTHAATEAPVPRYCDVLLHGLRHLHWLAQTDGENAAAMGEMLGRQLEPFEPALATMYSERHQPAA